MLDLEAVESDQERPRVDYVIEVWDREAASSGAGLSLVRDMHDLGAAGVRAVRIAHVYRLNGNLDQDSADRLASELFADPLTQDYRVLDLNASAESELLHSAGPGRDRIDPNAPTEVGLPRYWGQGGKSIEVAFNPGVMDPREESIRKAASHLGVTLTAVRTATRYEIEGAISDADMRLVTDRLLLNKTVQHATLPGERATLTTSPYTFRLVHISLIDAEESELERLSREGQLWLTLDEMRAIRDYFRDIQRSPTDVELETLAQTWSEHCVHKTLKGDIRWKGGVIRNLLKSTIARATEEIAADWCLSVFQDNAGVIVFDDEHAVCFKVETHNHPSALEPYGGASTGLGGVIRDVIGAGLSARPVLNTDVFCFGPPDLPYDRLPKGTLHPKRVFKGVRAGVADYGNRMGIPTSNGAILFDERYVGNPLVFCGTVGVMPCDAALPGRQDPGDLALVVGGRTGRDGIHGATFSSGELTAESEVTSASSVQIGAAITEKRVLDALLQARDRRLFKRITDCGAGGLSSACGEMGEETGIEVYLDRVPLKYEGLSYTEIWISEAQERMVIAVDPASLDAIMEIFEAEDVEATVIGRFTDDRRLRLYYEGNLVGDLPMELVHHGLPRLEREADWTPPAIEPVHLRPAADLTSDLERILAAPNVCSKEWVIRQYDHEVQGGSVLKPLVGIDSDGPGDACVVRPLLNSMRGIVVSCGINPHYGDLDPYGMAASAIDEAIRQIVAVGGPPDRVALLDNFSWGNTAKPDRLGALVRACQACYDVAVGYGAPFISGKDSLNNEYMVDGESICIPHTLLISAISVMPDVTLAVSMDAKSAGNLIYLVGLTRAEMGGSHYYVTHEIRGGQVPQVNVSLGRSVFEGIHRAIRNVQVRACHDCSEGGLGVAAAEMAFAGGLGMEIDLSGVPAEGDLRDDEILFSESNSRFVVEVAPESAGAFEAALGSAPFARIGRLTESPQFVVTGHSRPGEPVVSVPTARLKAAWQSTLAW